MRHPLQLQTPSPKLSSITMITVHATYVPTNFPVMKVISSMAMVLDQCWPKDLWLGVAVED